MGDVEYNILRARNRSSDSTAIALRRRTPTFVVVSEGTWMGLW